MDEIHLITSFENTFKKEFEMLKDTLLSKLNSDCPMLFLTASCTADIQHDFEYLMQLHISRWQWPSANNMDHRSVSIHTHYTTKPFQLVMKTFKNVISNPSPATASESASASESDSVPPIFLTFPTKLSFTPILGRRFLTSPITLRRR